MRHLLLLPFAALAVFAAQPALHAADPASWPTPSPLAPVIHGVLDQPAIERQLAAGRQAEVEHALKAMDEAGGMSPAVTFCWGVVVRSRFNFGNSHAIFAGVNATLAAWAIVSYIGIGKSIVDVWIGATGWLFVERAGTKNVPERADPGLDWRAAIYNGAPATTADVGLRAGDSVRGLQGADEEESVAA